MSEVQEESVDIPSRGRIAQILTLCAVLAGGCGATAQNADIEDLEAEVDNKPEWVDGQPVFEKDGKVFGVGMVDSHSSKNISLIRTAAIGCARTSIEQYLGLEDGDIYNSETVEIWLAPDGKVYVLVSVPK